MTFEEAKALLDSCERDELVDFTFGDAEVSWFKDGQEVASAYFGNSGSSVGSYDLITDTKEQIAKRWKFHGAEADRLRHAGTLKRYMRNDDGGGFPDE